MPEHDGFLKPVRLGVEKAKKHIQAGAKAKDGRVKRSSRLAAALLMAAVLAFWGFGVWFHLILSNLK